MHPLLLAALLGLPQASPAPVPPPAPAPSTVHPLAFYSGTFPYLWNRLIPLSIDLDGLKVKSIFFDIRKPESNFFGLLKGAEFGTRAQLEVTNTSKYPKVPGFAVAVLDKDGQLLGVASGGTKLGTVKPGDTETFDLNFTQVKERLPKGDHFVLSIELRD
ncbi:MAG TPA: hypothetical protein VF768_02865 [Holophagaceae bacterium]